VLPSEIGKMKFARRSQTFSIDELDLVGPIQVFGAANRLAPNSVYEVEIVTNGTDLRVQGEGGLLCFAAQGRFQDVKEKFDSLLLVCGLATRTALAPALFAPGAETCFGKGAIEMYCSRRFPLPARESIL
jgi:hypothetical protein